MTTDKNGKGKKQIKVLVTGATGYIGGRLTPKLIKKGYDVRVMVRHSLERLQAREWADKVEILQGDILKPDTLPDSFTDIDAAYYLIHSMKKGDEFEERDKRAARNFGRAAAEAGVKRIIYLDGLGDPADDLSPHLRSRQKVGEVLRESGIPVTDFQAAVVIGSGSASFEMVRHLVERLPIMLQPSWARNRIQPIAIRDVLDYLVAALETPASADKIVQIGGTDVQTYSGIMRVYAEVRGLKRLVIPVPLLTPWLSSHWVNLVTPIPASYARPLIEGAKNETIVRDDLAKQLFPQIDPVDTRTAIAEALENLQKGEVNTLWSDAVISSKGDAAPYTFVEEQGMYIERREQMVEASPEAVYQVFTRLGGATGWPDYQWLWRIRGLMDKVIGGPGLRRGRRHSSYLAVGDPLDFWRVEALEHSHLMRLQAEMKVPGRAWLQFEVTKDGDGSTLSKVVQTAYFAPKGIWGFLYWWAVYPFHGPVFTGLLRYVAHQAEQESLAEGQTAAANSLS